MKKQNVAEIAKDICMLAHRGQERKYTCEAYSTHPKAVAELAKQYRMLECEQAAAWLHDVLEDCGGYWASVILEKCGIVVLTLVCELTKEALDNVPRDTKKQIRNQRLATVSQAAKSLKMLDRICNLHDFAGPVPKEWATEYIQDSKELWQICANAHEEIGNLLLETIQKTQKEFIAGV